MTEPKDITYPDNAMTRALDAAASRSGGTSSRMGPPPSPTPEEIRAQVNRDWGPAGEVPAPALETEPPQQQEPLGSNVSPTPAPSAGPFRYIDMNTYTVVTATGEYFPIKDMNIQKTLMMIARDTVWFTTNDKFIAMSEQYGLPLPKVRQQEAPNVETPMPPVPPSEKPPKVSVKKGKVPKVPTTNKSDAE